jgi:hypothetical protein
MLPKLPAQRNISMENLIMKSLERKTVMDLSRYFPIPVVVGGVDGRIWLLGIVVVFVLSVRKRERLMTWLILERSNLRLNSCTRRVALGVDVWMFVWLIWFWGLEMQCH